MLKTRVAVKKWLDRMVIENYTIHDDLSVDVKGNVYISNRNLKELPVQFNKVTSHFDFSINELTSLKGCPQVVGGDFDCSRNLLTSLEYGSSYVKGSYDCCNNDLIDLKYSPEHVGIDFICNNNSIKTLKYSPGLVNGNFDCHNNPIVNIYDFKCNFGGTFKHAHLVIEHMKEFYDQDPTFKTEKSLRLNKNELKTILDFQNYKKTVVFNYKDLDQKIQPKDTDEPNKAKFKL